MDDRIKGALGMKQTGRRIKHISLMVSTFTTLSSFASVKMSLDCPDKFIAKIKDVYSPEAPDHIYSKVKVQLKVIEALSDLSLKNEDKSFEILKHSAGSFNIGETYQVSMREKWLCKFKKLN